MARKSHFLLGPRQTGKTTLIRDALPGGRSYDLLDSRVFLELSRSPQRLAEELDDPHRHLRSPERLKALAEEQRFQRYICVAMVDRPRTVNGITVMPWRHFFDALWAGEFR